VCSSDLGVWEISLTDIVHSQLIGTLSTVAPDSMDLQITLDSEIESVQNNAISASPDCNANGVPDHVEIAVYSTLDWNGDGILDSCQQGQGLSGILPGVAVDYELHNAYPNPFNPSTQISFEAPRESVASLRVYDVSGRVVAILLDDENVHEGRNTVFWNGRDDIGRSVPTGVYFYRLIAGRFDETKRMVLIK